MNTENEKTAVSEIIRDLVTGIDPKVRYYLNATVDDAMGYALEFKKDLGDLAKGLIELEKRVSSGGWVEFYPINKYSIETYMVYTHSAITIASHLMPLLGKRIGAQVYNDVYASIRDRILLIAYIHKGIKLVVVEIQDNIQAAHPEWNKGREFVDIFKGGYTMVSNKFIAYAEQLRIDAITLGVK